MSHQITWTQNGEINIVGSFNGKDFTAQVIDLTDIGIGLASQSLHNISELEAIEIIQRSCYITVAERHMRAVASELEYQAQEEQKRIQEMENREEESCPLCDTYHDDWDSCFSIREQY